MPRLWRVGQKVAATRDILDGTERIKQHTRGTIINVNRTEPDGYVCEVLFQTSQDHWNVRDSEVKRVS